MRPLDMVRCGTIASLLVAALSAGTATADTAIKPTMVVDTKWIYYIVNNIIGGNGLSSAVNTGDSLPITATHALDNGDTGPGGNVYIGQGTDVYTFDLGDVYNVSAVDIWNYNQSGNTDRGITAFYVSTSVDNITYGATTQLIPFNLAGGTGTEPVQRKAYSASGIRYVRFSSATTGAAGMFGLSEVRFEGVFVGGATPWPSLAVTNGLQLWLDASKNPAQSDNTTVTTWYDQSGNLRDTAAVTGTPKYRTAVAALNNKPAIQFDGSSYFTLGNINSAFPSAATLFVVANLTTANDYNLYITGGNNDTPYWESGGVSYNGCFRANRLEGAGTMPKTGSYIFRLESSGSTYLVDTNGANAVNAVASYSKGTAAGHQIAGGSGPNLTGYIPEIIVYDRTLNSTEVNQIGGYLAAKYGIITSYPAATSAQTGTTYFFQ